MVDLTRTPSFRLDGKRALVTGAGRGIGLAAASALADAGAHVTLAARTVDELEDAALAICARGQQASTMQLDVREVEAAQKTITAQEPFDILVNNAGTNRPAPFIDVTVEDYDFVTDLNVRAAYFVAHYFVYPVYSDLVADDAEKVELANVIDRITSHIVDNNYQLIDVDGQRTRWGWWAPELIWEDPDETGLRSVNWEAITEALGRSRFAYDKHGEDHYNLASALIKSLRNSDANAGLYWLARLIEGGADPMFIARRLCILASEDVGLADPQAMVQAAAAAQITHLIGLPEALFPLSQTVVYLALLRTPTSDPDVVDHMLGANRTLFQLNRSLGGTHYPFSALRLSRQDWERHYGSYWGQLLTAKQRYDPDNVFASGQDIL